MVVRHWMCHNMVGEPNARSFMNSYIVGKSVTFHIANRLTSTNKVFVMIVNDLNNIVAHP